MQEPKFGDLLGERERVLAYIGYEDAYAGTALTIHGGDFYVCSVHFDQATRKWEIDRSTCYADDFDKGFADFCELTGFTPGETS